MPNLFSTFGRAALVAIGLAVAPAAYAQGTFSCPTGFTPLVSANEVTCQMACASGTPTPVINGTSMSFTCNTGGGGGTAPNGCSLTVSPSSGGPAATPVTLSLNCGASTTVPANITWTGGASNALVANCPSSTSTWPVTCNVGSLSQTVSNFSAAVSNGTIPNYTSSNKSFTYTAGGGGTDFVGCPTDARKSANFYPHPLETLGLTTGDIGTLPTGAVMSFKMNVTATSGSGGAKFAASYGGNRYATWTVSRNACDFSQANAVSWVPDPTRPTKLSYLYGQTSSGITPFWSYGASGPLPPGVYYFNIRIESCLTDDCYYTNLKLY